MHPIGEVDIEVTGAEEHRVVPRRPALECVRCRIGLTAVRLDLGETNRYTVSGDKRPQELRRHRQGIGEKIDQVVPTLPQYANW